MDVFRTLCLKVDCASGFQAVREGWVPLPWLLLASPAVVQNLVCRMGRGSGPSVSRATESGPGEAKCL